MEVDMIAKAFNDMVFFHAFFMAFFPIPFLINLYTLFTYKTYQKVIIKLWFVMPIIFLLVAWGALAGCYLSKSAMVYDLADWGDDRAYFADFSYGDQADKTT
ncbi:hypothetical protein [Helicobacter canis]|uniref:Uncharacterized protein n=1 Tax=Helicobacter canis TaxID=29419 RepID=A0A377JNH8_9HELI|nr:hypothetical protein [Helicobacter canis]STP06558.1 Uncharacterised protein [Helicobacter canis]